MRRIKVELKTDFAFGCLRLVSLIQRSRWAASLCKITADLVLWESELLVCYGKDTRLLCLASMLAECPRGVGYSFPAIVE